MRSKVRGIAISCGLRTRHPEPLVGILPALNQAEESQRGDYGSGTKAGHDRLLDAEPQRAQCPQGLADD